MVFVVDLNDTAIISRKRSCDVMETTICCMHVEIW